MFIRIIKTEWRNLFAERSFILLTLAFAVLLGYGVWSGSSWIAERKSESQQLLDKQASDLAERRTKTAQGFKGSTEPYEPDPSDPYSIGMSLQYASLPFSPAAAFSIGQADVLPLDAGVTVSTLQRTKADKGGFENPLSFLPGRFDLSFIIVYLLPLFVLALSFNILSGERERGTLRLLLSQPLKLRSLLTAKTIALFVLISAVVLAVSLVGVLLTVGDFSTDFWIRSALWVLLVLAYSAFWFGLAIFVNSLGYSSATNAVVCAASWLVLVLILPSLLNVAISSAYPVPSRSELISAVRSVNLDMRRDGSRILAEHYQDHPELMPKDGKTDLEDFGLAFVLVQREQKQRVDAVEARFAEQLANQQSLIRSFRFISPSVIAQEASNDIAGTGLSRYQHFRAQVKQFDTAWADFFVPRIFKKENLIAQDFDSIPRFIWSEEPKDSVVMRAGVGILYLILISAVLLIVAFRKLGNYRLEK